MLSGARSEQEPRTRIDRRTVSESYPGHAPIPVYAFLACGAIFA